jgi:ATP-dependent protease HslVU (ClpYQ) ATPase subunit
MTTLLEDLLFDLPDTPTKQFVFDAGDVRDRLVRILSDEDLRKYIL